jgi:hypothetical protein
MKARLFLLALLALLTGCGGGGGTDAGAQRYGTVLGVVRDSLQSDQGVSGATIQIGAISGTTTTLDQAGPEREVGSYALKTVAVGSNTAKVTLPSGEVQTVAFYPPIGPGTNADVDIIVNIGQVRGRILGPDGKPVRDAAVYLTADGPTDSVVSLADGSFLIQNVLPGAAEVTAVNGTQSAVKPVTVGKGVTDIGDLTLADDPNPNPLGAPRTLFGKVTLSPGGEAGAGTVLILLRNGIQYETQVANAEGEYQFYVPAGTYALKALREAYLDGDASITIADANRPVRQDFSLQPR